MNIKNFGASNGWLFSFFKRNGLSINDFNSKINDNISKENISIEKLDLNVEDEPNDVQYEIEYNEQPITDGGINADLNTECYKEWKNWCKCCGSNEQTELIYGVNENSFDILKSIFRSNFAFELRCCERCKIQLEQTIKFLTMTLNVENMLIELEEQEKVQKISEEAIRSIRQIYLNEIQTQDQISDEAEQQQHINQIETEEDIVYEEDYLEEEINDIEQQENYVVVEESVAINNQEHEASNRMQDEENYIYECHICGENFDLMCFLTNHTRQVHNCLPQVACSCGKYLATWDSLMAHKRKHSTEPADWICDTCNSRFQTKTGLSIHIKFKHSLKASHVIHRCDICNIECKDMSSLKNHIKIHHLQNEEKSQVECALCSKKLSNKYSLKAHVATVHEKQKSILCHLCSKGFSNKSNLRSHLVSHTTEYISCNICNQVFKNRVSLQSHKKIHKPHESLKFVCNQCGKRFHNNNHLERHLISHSSEKKFKCTYDGCDAAYKWEKDLKNHESIHKGIKNHQCQFCERFFTDIANLRKHKLRHHHSELSELEKMYGKKRALV